MLLLINTPAALMGIPSLDLQTNPPGIRMNKFSDLTDSYYHLMCEEIVRLVDYQATGRVNGRRTCESYRHEL